MDPGRVALRRYVAALKSRVEFLRLEVTARKIVVGQASTITVFLGLALASNRWEICGLVVLAGVVPWLWLERRVNQRVSAIEAQTDIWLGALANALRASPSLGEAIASTIVVTEAPLSQELETLMKDYELGTPLDEALTNLGQRCRSQVMDACLQALRVARKSGGNLTDTLESAAAALRELARLEGVVRTKTAEGKMQAIVIGVVPIPLVCIVNWIDPLFFAPLWNSFTGHLLLGLATVLWFAAVLLARKIVAVDV
jgi:tight adherence protein B